MLNSKIKSLETFLSSMPQGIIICDLDENNNTSPIFISDEIYNITGYTKEEFASKMYDIIHPEDYPYFKSHFSKALSSKEPLTASFHITCKNKELILVNVVGCLSESDNERLLYISFTAVADETLISHKITLDGSIGVCIIEKATHKLLFLNEAMKDAISEKNYLGKICHKAIRHSENVCSFCVPFNNLELGVDHEVFTPSNGRYYTIRASEIVWKDTPAYIEYIKDITNETLIKKDKEHVLNQLERFYQNSDAAILKVEANNEWTLLEANNRFYDMIGYTKEQFKKEQNNSLMNVISPETKQTTQQYTTPSEIGKKGTNSNVLVTRSGERIDVIATGEFIQEEDGLHIYATITDTTMLMKLRDENTKLKEDYELILANSPTGIAKLQKFEDGSIIPVFISESLLALFKMTREQAFQVYGEDAFNGIHINDRDRVRNYFVDTNDDGDKFDTTCRVETGDNSYMWVRVSGTLKKEAGISYLYACYIDVSNEIKIANEIKSIHTNIPGAVLHCKSNENLDLIEANDKLYNFIGYTREEFSKFGNSIIKIVHPEDISALRKIISEKLETKEPFEVTHRIICKNSIKWVYGKGQICEDIKGDPYIYAILIDVTKQKDLEEKDNIQKQELEIAIENAGILFIEYNSNTHTTIANSNVIKTFKTPRIMENFPQSLIDLGLIHPDDIDIYRKVYENIDNGSPREDFECRVYNPAFRKWRWMKGHCNTIFNKNGEPIKTICTAEDIDKFKDLENNYNFIINRFGISSWKFNLITREIYAPSNLVAYFGLDGNIIKDAPNFFQKSNIVHEEDKPILKELFNKLDSGENEVTCALRTLDKTGKYSWIKLSYSVIDNNDGKREWVVATFIDITKEMEEKERNQNIKLMHRRNLPSNTLLSAYTSLNKNKVLEINDLINSDLNLNTNMTHDNLLSTISHTITDNNERDKFNRKFKRSTLLNAFNYGITSFSLNSWLQFSEDSDSVYTKLKLNLVSDTTTGDILCLVSIVDVTQELETQTLLSSTVKNGFDFIIAINLQTRQVSNIIHNDIKILEHFKKEEYVKLKDTAIEAYCSPSERENMSHIFDLNNIEKILEVKGEFSTSLTIHIDGKTKTKKFQFYYMGPKKKRICIACIDITKSIEKSQKLLSLLANTVERAGIINADTHAYTMHTVETVRNNISPLYGENFKDYTSHVFEDAAIPELREQYTTLFDMDRIKDELNKEDKKYVTIPYKLYQDGEIHFKESKLFWIDQSHEFIGLLRADTTERELMHAKQKEDIINALRMANQANNAKSTFLSAMSHDIRTPMNAIIGMTEIALSDTNNTGQVKESLETVKSSSNQLLSLLNDILDMSRIEAGQMVLAKSTFSQRKEYEKLICRMTAPAKSKGINFQHSFNIINDMCIGDTLKLNRVLDNLVGNAMKFTQPGGTVAVHFNELTHNRTNIGLYQYVISDTGVGMDEETQKHLFEPFYQSCNKDMEFKVGSGLGLSIVKSIVDFCDGKIGVQSELGKGTTFTVTIHVPLANKPEAKENNEISDKKSTDLELSKLKGKRVLLAEDNKVNQRVVIKILNRVGVEVVVAKNGKEAVEIFTTSQHGTFNAILMDIQMPIMNGINATKTIRKLDNAYATTIPILAITANAFNEDVQRCTEAGMNEHISKPIMPDTLYKTLSKYI
ncbi:MAG: PAS domain-containing protein [Synergistaceae bacterium]